MAQIPYVFASADASVPLADGSQVPIRKGTHWYASDPVVVQYPHLFSSDPRYGMHYTHRPDDFDAEIPVEAATAAPGEKRTGTRRG